ncbi:MULTISPECIES: D-2-hydroxyacid dehydrogenase [Chelativorans]|uniref:D-isomer specific 2-hydroxyacid dehydrogenase, NAD-binding protein n=1 Tax=Chelativorans sp. (strain BNC1) TaxID=266779 RepID=Q11AU8_CHESB|nr:MULTISPECIES: D-2-hydroxyacid dehydrogenase [Chelativorans]
MISRQIKKVLATVEYKGWHLERLKEIFAPAELIQISPDDDLGIERELRNVDVCVLKSDLDARFVAANQLKWIHCDHSGVNKSARPEVIARKDLIVTSSAGRAAPALAAHTFFFVLALTYDVPALVEAKKKHEWRKIAGFSDRRGPYGKTLGVIGLGYTGKEVIALGRAFGMRVLGYGRGSEQAKIAGLDQYFDGGAGETIDTLLKESDFVVLSVRLTNETYRLIGSRELALMKPSAYLINMARGNVIDEAALVQALHDGTIAGAGLDVFEQEPLPPNAPIWDAPNTVITHHQTAEMPDLVARSLDIIAENARRYRAGEKLLNQIKAQDVYTH